MLTGHCLFSIDCLYLHKQWQDIHVFTITFSFDSGYKKKINLWPGQFSLLKHFNLKKKSHSWIRVCINLFAKSSLQVSIMHPSIHPSSVIIFLIACHHDTSVMFGISSQHLVCILKSVPIANSHVRFLDLEFSLQKTTNRSWS